MKHPIIDWCNASALIFIHPLVGGDILEFIRFLVVLPGGAANILLKELRNFAIKEEVMKIFRS